MALFTRNKIPQVTPTEENQVFVANTDRYPAHVTLDLDFDTVFGLVGKFMFAVMIWSVIFAIPIVFVLIGLGIVG